MLQTIRSDIRAQLEGAGWKVLDPGQDHRRAARTVVLTLEDASQTPIAVILNRVDVPVRLQGRIVRRPTTYDQAVGAAQSLLDAISRGSGWRLDIASGTVVSVAEAASYWVLNCEVFPYYYTAK